jgi:tRNA A-37 threonylcarbamoyl transferase component Bud32
MGAIYVVEQVRTGKQRALKLMLPQLVSDQTLRKRFEQEARVGSQIESEHVVEVVGAGVDGTTGMPWLAMELLKGEDLSRVVARQGPVPPSLVVAIFEQLCHAVAAAHRAGIVHRDLKPENIFLTRPKRAGTEFTVKVLDFGIAKIVAEAKTTRTAAIGSPMWMAPEQAERATIMPATDVWALGLIAFHLLTGRFFWKAANSDDVTVPQLMREILFDSIPAASARARELGWTSPLPGDFDDWFAGCVTRDARARYPDADTAFRRLRRASAIQATVSDPTIAVRPERVVGTQKATPSVAAATVDDAHPPAVVAGSGTMPASAYTLARAHALPGIARDQGRRGDMARQLPGTRKIAMFGIALAVVAIGALVGAVLRSTNQSRGHAAADVQPATSAMGAASGVQIATIVLPPLTQSTASTASPAALSAAGTSAVAAGPGRTLPPSRAPKAQGPPPEVDPHMKEVLEQDVPPPPLAGRKADCGCNGDLMCLMKCSSAANSPGGTKGTSAPMPVPPQDDPNNPYK